MIITEFFQCLNFSDLYSTDMYRYNPLRWPLYWELGHRLRRQEGWVGCRPHSRQYWTKPTQVVCGRVVSHWTAGWDRFGVAISVDFVSSLIHLAFSVQSIGRVYIPSTFWKYLGRAKRIWYLSPMRAAKVQASLRIRAVSPEPPLLAHTSSESRGTFRQKTRSLAPLNGWTCAVKVCHDGMLEDTNSLGAAHLKHLLALLIMPPGKLDRFIWATTGQNQQIICAPSEDSD